MVRVEGDLDRLGVAGAAGGDLLVGGIVRATGVPELSAFTPGRPRNAVSTPQKQPAANVAFSKLLFMFWLVNDGTLLLRSRPRSHGGTR